MHYIYIYLITKWKIQRPLLILFLLLATMCKVQILFHIPIVRQVDTDFIKHIYVDLQRRVPYLDVKF